MPKFKYHYILVKLDCFFRKHIIDSAKDLEGIKIKQKENPNATIKRERITIQEWNRRYCQGN